MAPGSRVTRAQRWQERDSESRAAGSLAADRLRRYTREPRTLGAEEEFTLALYLWRAIIGVPALLGYAWLKGKLAPPSGLFVHPHTVAIMLIWFGLCFSPVVPNMANGAQHAAGLGLGSLWGILEGWSFRRRLVR